jgi:hypothetical protein
MVQKISYNLLIIITLLSWPLSLLINKPSFSFESIFYKTSTEISTYNQAYSLGKVPLNQIFYGKHSIYLDHFTNNFFNHIDINNYFFMSHPRENLPENTSRFKYPFISLIGLLVFIIKILKIDIKTRPSPYFYLLILVFLLSFIKKSDGYDFIFYPFISSSIISGYKYIQKSQYSSLLNIVLLLISLFEIIKIL